MLANKERAQRRFSASFSYYHIEHLLWANIGIIIGRYWVDFLTFGLYGLSLSFSVGILSG
jgi:hypothetical protein